MARVTVEESVVTVFPLASSTVTLGWVDQAVPEAPPVGWVVNTNLAGGGGVTFHVNVAVAVSVCESVAVTVTEQAQGADGVPVTAPVVELIESPAGSPVAENVTAFPPVVSCGAAMVSVLIAVPVMPDWVPGLVTDSASTFHVSVIDPFAPTVALVPPAAPTANVGEAL